MKAAKYCPQVSPDGVSRVMVSRGEQVTVVLPRPVEMNALIK